VAAFADTVRADADLPGVRDLFGRKPDYDLARPVLSHCG